MTNFVLDNKRSSPGSQERQGETACVARLLFKYFDLKKKQQPDLGKRSRSDNFI